VILYQYGSEEITAGTVAVVAGGGNEMDTLKEISELGLNTFVTGISSKSDYSKKAHIYAEKNGINILGGTHYSTEKFACMELCKYFRRLGVPSLFIRDKPVMEDM